LPVFYEKDIYPYCRNINIEDTNFDIFYEPVTNTGLSGIIKQLMIDVFKINILKINFIIFTVINTTDNGIVNNPPNPPYININNLIYYSTIKSNEEKLKNEFLKVVFQMYTYSFYQYNSEMNPIFSFFNNINGQSFETLKNYVNDLILIVQQNNPSTLIGSLQSTDLLQNIVYNKVVCSYNEDLNSLFNDFNGNKNFELNQTHNGLSIKEINGKIGSNATITDYENDNDISIKQKYLKYKQKYLELKAKSKY